MRRALQTLGLAVLLAVLVAVCEPQFGSAENLANLARQIGLHGILAVGVGVVMLTGGIDLSVGSVSALSGLLFAKSFTASADAGIHAWGLALGAGLLVGLGQGFLIAWLGLPPFVVTLCGLLIVRGATRFLTEDQAMGLGARGYELSGIIEESLLGIPVPLWILAGLSGFSALVLHRTVLGRHLYALGSNREAARLGGINTQALEMMAYAWSGLLAAGSGVLFLIYTNSLQPATAGAGYELAAIAAAVVGGTSLRGGSGTVLGMVAGVLLLRFLLNATTLLRVPTYLDGAVSGAALLVGAGLDAWSRRNRR